MGANESTPSSFLKIGKYHISRLSGINFFSYLKPQKEYLGNVHVPLVMCMGEYHLSQSTFATYPGECEDCKLPTCTDMERTELFDLLLEELEARNILDVPFDVYTETSYFDYKKSGNTKSKIGRLYENARELHHKFPKRIRSHSNDPRLFDPNSTWYESRLLNHYEWTPENMELMRYLITGDYQQISNFIFSTLQEHSTKSVIWKELSKQDPNFFSRDGRPMTDLSMWKDVFEILLRIQLDNHKFNFNIRPEEYIEILEKIQVGDSIKTTPEFRSFLVVNLASLLDLYQLARMFKIQCLGKTEEECLPLYPMLAMIITGSSHSKSISSVLTNPFSPICFYTADVRINNIMFEFEGGSHWFKTYNRDQELTDCIDFSLYRHSIDLINDIKRWLNPQVRNENRENRENRQILIAPRSVGRVRRRLENFDEYLKNDAILLYKPLPIEELLTTMPIQHLM